MNEEKVITPEELQEKLNDIWDRHITEDQAIIEANEYNNECVNTITKAKKEWEKEIREEIRDGVCDLFGISVKELEDLKEATLLNKPQ